jgi:hypothetical protein
MGRPIKKKFFGNTITPYQNHATGGKTGVGGEGFSTLVLLNGNSTSFYSTTTTVTWAASVPQLTGGISASGTATVSNAGKVTALNLSNTGTGYTSTGSVTVTFSPATTGTAATYAVQLTSNRQDAIVFSSWIPGAGGAQTNGDILKQEASHRYLVQNSDGKGQCKLVASDTLAEGEMYITATDANGATYWVTKLTAHKARLKQRTAGGGYLIADGAQTGWNIGSPTGTIVTLSNTN